MFGTDDGTGQRNTGENHIDDTAAAVSYGPSLPPGGELTINTTLDFVHSQHRSHRSRGRLRPTRICDRLRLTMSLCAP